MTTRLAGLPVALVLMLLLASAALIGCGGARSGGEKTGEAVLGADDPAAREVCYANQLIARNEVVAFYMNNPEARPPMQVSVLIQQGALKKAPVCPAGGDFKSFNSQDLGFICSIHGEAPAD
ncbi:MAG: hypothetical protein C0418_06455 [Coriobacteriaceae bacterium]|nr:hypothetical protein [Coriobacteriaceae bacterium]